MLRLPRLLLLSSASCKWSYRRALLLQMIIRSGQPFANYYLEWPASYKWSLLSPLFSRKFPPHNLNLTLNANYWMGGFWNFSVPYGINIFNSSSSPSDNEWTNPRGACLPKGWQGEQAKGGLVHSRIGTGCFLFKLKEYALGLAWHLSHHGIWQNFRLFLRYFVQDSNCE